MALKTVNTPDKNLQLVQDYVNDELVPLQGSPLVNGNMVTAVSLTSGQDNLVQHKLGYTPSFFVITNQNANTAVWTAASSSLGNASANNFFMNLRCGTTCTVSVWFR